MRARACSAEFIGFGAMVSFYIENKRFDLDTLRVANRSPTPASKISDFLGVFDDIWGVRGRLPRPIWGVPGVPAGIKNIYFQKHPNIYRVWGRSRKWP